MTITVMVFGPVAMATPLDAPPFGTGVPFTVTFAVEIVGVALTISNGVPLDTDAA